MSRRANLWGVAWLLSVAAFVVALAYLFALRFESGEVYPPYSTFRADPLGCRALYESLDGLGGLRVSRNLDPLPSLDAPRGQTLCLFGVTPAQLRVSTTEARELEGFVRRGGRLVMTFLASTWAPEPATNKPPSKTTPKKTREHRFTTSLARNWGVEFRLVPLPTDQEDESAQAVLHEAQTSLPPSVSWHSTLVFTNLHSDWNVIYTRDGHPVIIERALGNGSLVWAADTYFVSNEALLRERHPSLLTWLIGPATRVIFDETHLGVVERPGVATLLRQYRLQGLLAAMLALAGLFLWRQSSPFPPLERDSGHESDLIAGRTAAAGFVNLLRRSIPPQRLLSVCVAEWEKSFPRHSRMAAVRELAQEPAPVAGYRKIRQRLAERALPTAERNQP